jgi:chemotaxis protein MotB
MKLHQRVRRGQVSHADDWLITYADVITLLLCLFVVLVSVKSQSPAAARHAAASVETKAPDGFSVFPPPSVVTFGGDFVSPTANESLSEKTESEEDPESIGTPSANSTSVITMPAASPDVPPSQGELPEIVDRLRGKALLGGQGDRITTLQMSSAAFFGSGYATLSSAGKSILQGVAATLSSGEFASYRISVEGHTDDSPIATAQFQSNWELSTARAAAVVRFLLEQGIPARRLTAAGYADTFPIAPNRNAEGAVIPENQALNRRVVIRLEKIEKPD